MQNRVNRASQFMSFDALNGFTDALRLMEKVVEEKKALSIDQEDILNRQFQTISIGDYLELSFYYQTEYIKVMGVVKKIDYIHKWMIVADTKIALEDIISIKRLEKDEVV